jgi:outer membrane lipoprotein carrier protein
MLVRASLVGAFLLPSGLSQAQVDLSILRRVDAHYNHLSSLRTRYTEHYAGMGLDRTESGTLTLRKPGRMRWQYDRPAGKVFVLNGKFAWFYTPGDPEAQRIPASQMDDLRTPLRFLLGHTELSKELDAISITPGGDDLAIAGVPKGMQRRVRRLTLHVSTSGAIEAIKIEEMDSAITEFIFSAMEENVRVPDSDFHFTPPPGVTIVDAP